MEKQNVFNRAIPIHIELIKRLFDKKDVDKNVINTLINQFTQEPQLYHPLTEKLVKIMYPSVQIPHSMRTAYDLFVKLLDLAQNHSALCNSAE